jgi:proteasome accessory factor C
MANNSRLARLIDLVPYIVSHQGVSIDALAKKFGVSVKEIEKDLWLLYMCGLPGQTPLELMEFQFEDGFVTVRNADELKQPRSLTQTEIASLVIGLEILREQGSERSGQLKDLLSSKLNSSIDFEVTASDKYASEINQAIQNNKVIRIKYLNKTREVLPFEIYKDGGQVYLKAHCKAAKDRRTFNVNRIENLEVLANSELAPNDVPATSSKKSSSIIVHSNQRLTRELLGSTDNVEHFSDEWLVQQILALGGAVEAITPAIRSEISNRAKAALALYI